MTKFLQILAAIAFVIAGIALLCAPSSAQTIAAAPAAAAAFAPTRFTVVDQGIVGKPDVVLIPGLTSGREVWAAEAAKLAPNYRLHLLQVDGFAGQPAGPNVSGTAILPAMVEELHAYITATAMHPVVVGHSLGGLMTLMLADKYPADASKIVIVDSLPFFGMMFGPQVTVDLVQPQAAMMRDMLEKPSSPEQRAAMAQKTAETLALNEEARRIVKQESLASDPHVMAEAMYEDFTTDLRPELANIKVKALMLYPYDPALQMGGQAPKVDELYQGAYKPMPNVKVVRVDGSRHFIMYDQPEKFDAALEEFLK